MRVSRGGTSICHLLFVDDSLLVSKAIATQVRLVDELMLLFCKASGLKANVNKSTAMLL